MRRDKRNLGTMSDGASAISDNPRITDRQLAIEGTHPRVFLGGYPLHSPNHYRLWFSFDCACCSEAFAIDLPPPELFIETNVALR